MNSNVDQIDEEGRRPRAGRRRARLVLWAAGVMVLLGLVGGGIASSHLTSSLSDYDAPGSAVVLAQHQIQRATGANPEEGYEVVVRTATPIGASSPVPARVATVVALLRARPEVKSVLDYANTGDPSMISKGGDFTVVVATVGDVQEKQAVTALERAIAAHPSLKGNTWLGGPTVADVQIAAVSSQDLGRAELYALPFLVLLLFFVFRGLRAAAVPLVGAVFAIAVTLGVMGLVIVALPLSVFALNLVIALGLGLSVDFSLLIVSRFREEFRRQGSIDGALVTVRTTAGRTVLFSSFTIAAAMATLAIFPERFVYSMGIAGAIVVLAAGAFALLVLPSLLTVFGERIAAHTPSRRRPTPLAGEAQATGRWYRIAALVMRRPALWVLSAVLVLVVLAAPFLHVSFTGADASALPASSSAGTAYALVQTNFTAFSEAPASLVVDAAGVTANELAPFAAKAAAVPGVKAVSAFQHLGGSLWESNVALSSAPLSPAAQRTVNDAAIPPRPRTGHRGRTDGVLLDAAEEPQVPSPRRARADRPDRPCDALRHDAVGGAPAHGRGDEHPDHRRHLRHARVGLPVGPPQPPLGVQRPGGAAVDVAHHHPRRGVRTLDRLRRLPARPDEGGA